MKNQEISNYLQDYFPKGLKNAFCEATKGIKGNIREIRLYKDMPVIFVTDCGTRFPDINGGSTSFPTGMSIVADGSLLSEIIINSTDAAVFSMEKELKEGYVTVSGGIRIGVCVSQADKCFSVNRITSVNIRFPYNDFFEPDFEVKELITQGGLLIAGPPCSGKTTLLKACCRELSDIRSPDFGKISIIDTRGELASFAKANRGAYAADVITCKNPGEGILRGVRLMSPEYIICDEICSDFEAQSILEGLNSGVKFISAMHAGDIAQLVRRSQFRRLFSENVFSAVVLLSAVQVGKIQKIYGREEICREIVRSDSRLCSVGFNRRENNCRNTEKE